MAKLIGIDWGSKRVGLAIGTSEAKISSPLESWSNSEDLIERLVSYCLKEGISTVIVGLPRGLEGQETAQTTEVRQFASHLQKALKMPVKLQDETLTSVMASKRSGDIDAQAAAVILQDYLDQL